MKERENRIMYFIYKREDFNNSNADRISLQVASAISNKYNNKGTIYIVEKTEDLIENYTPIELTKMMNLSKISENIITDNSSNINHIKNMIDMLSERATSEAPLIIYINDFLEIKQSIFKYNKDLNSDSKNYIVLDLFKMVVNKISNDKNIFIIFNDYITSPIKPGDKYTKEQLLLKKLKAITYLETIEMCDYLCRIDKRSKEITNFLSQTYNIHTKYIVTVLKNRIINTDNDPVYTINNLFTNIPDILNTLKITKVEAKDNEDTDLQKEMRSKIKISFETLYKIATFEFNDNIISLAEIKTRKCNNGKINTFYTVPNFIYNESTGKFEISSFMYKIGDAYKAMENGYIDHVSFDLMHGIFNPICTKEINNNPNMRIPRLDNIIYGYTILIRFQGLLSKKYYIITNNDTLRNVSDFNLDESLRIYDIAKFFENIEDVKEYIDEIRKEKIILEYEGYRVKINKEDDFKIIQSVRFS